MTLLSALVGVSPSVPDEDYPLCPRGLHPLTPDNVSQPGYGRCRKCKLEYNRLWRRGLPWTGPGERRSKARRDRSLPPAQLRRLRELVGACVECGWTPDMGPHRCPTA